jgi:4-alpha-glucanotransferase
MSDRPILAALAKRLGILPEYVSHDGRERRITTDATRVALLAAMGMDASSEASATAAMDVLESAESGQLVDPVQVTQTLGSEPLTVPIRIVTEGPASVDWFLELHTEQGEVHCAKGRMMLDSGARTAAMPVPTNPAAGYHRVRITVRANGRERTGQQSLIVTPRTCLTSTEKLGDRRLYGIWANLYSVRSAKTWGIGDLDSLNDLIAWASKSGAAFVGVNPLHATRNCGPDISPYRPRSRLYRNTAYLDISGFRELRDSPGASRRIGSGGLMAELERMRSSSHVDYQRVNRIKQDIFEPLHNEFVQNDRDRDTVGGRAYAEYLRQEGSALTDFATFLVLDEHFRSARGVANWRDWPRECRDPRSAEVERFRRDHGKEIDFQRFLQFELDRQLAVAAERARSGGMSIGLYQDLAIGTAPDGSDPWAFPGLFVEGVSVGAPPDDLGPDGQNWGLPPINPLRLRASGYEYWIRLLRSAFAHTGALRIDHVMGLLRQFWIPAGCSGSAGAYVGFPADDLFGILALESRRQNALVIGEDLGTVPPGFAEMLERWGVLSTQVLYFARGHHGEFLPPGQYSKRAMVTVNTHDLPPLGGYWDGRDLALRRDVGQLTGDEQLAAARTRRSQERDALSRALHREGLLGEGEAVSHADRCAAVHAFIARSPAPLMAVSLDDLGGESEPVNLPGVDPTYYPSWSRRMSMPLEDIFRSPTATRTLSAVRSERDGPPTGPM